MAEIDGTALAKSLEAIENYQFLVKPSREAWSRAIQLSYSSKISLYDAVYLGVSHVMKSPLLTADQKLINILPADEKTKVVPLAKLNLDYVNSTAANASNE